MAILVFEKKMHKTRRRQGEKEIRKKSIRDVLQWVNVVVS